MYNVQNKKNKLLKGAVIVVTILVFMIIFYYLYNNLQIHFTKTTNLTNIIINEYRIDSKTDFDEININISQVTATLGENYTKRLHDYSQYLYKNTYYDRENDIVISFIYIGGSEQSENYGRVTHIVYE